MAHTPLSTDFKDDILHSSVERRKYHQIFNEDGSVSFVDVTPYLQTGSVFGAKEVNEERKAINDIDERRIVTLDEIDLVTEEGFFVDALAVKELNGKSIVESGYNQYGHYRKYADGTLVMWGRKNISANTSTNNNGTLYWSNAYEIELPINSSSPATAEVGVESNGTLWTALVGGSFKNTVPLRFFSAHSYSGLSAIIHWRATGTWF